MTHAETAKLMAVLATAYRTATIDDRTIALYAQHLADLDYDDCQDAIGQIIQASQFFPTVAEIRSQVRENTDPLGWFQVFGRPDPERLDDDAVLAIAPGEPA